MITKLVEVGRVGVRPWKSWWKSFSRLMAGSQVVTRLNETEQLGASWQINGRWGLRVYVLDGWEAWGSASLLPVDSRQHQSGQEADPLIIIASCY